LESRKTHAGTMYPRGHVSPRNLAPHTVTSTIFSSRKHMHKTMPYLLL